MEHVWTHPICQEVFPFLEDSRCVHVYGLLTMEDAMIFRASMENSRAFSSTRSRSQGPKFHTGSERAGPTAPEKPILTAYRRRDMEEMNRKAREILKEKGVLGSLDTRVNVTDRSGEFRDTRTFCEGDRIVFLKNSKALDVKNGTTGTLEKIGLDGRGEWTFRVRTDEGKTVVFSPEDYAVIDHGYAQTIHKSQGATVEKSFNLVGGTGLEELYVQMTRHKGEAHIALVEDQIDRTADEVGIEMNPTGKMVDYARDLSRKLEVEFPEVCRTDFEACRDFLNKWSNHRIEDEEIDFGLEKVESLIESLSRSRERANVLDYEIKEELEITEEPEREGKQEYREIVREIEIER